MKMLITTWSEQGIPFAETRGRMAERGDDECFAMYAVLVADGLLPAELLRLLGRLAHKLRSTRAVLDLMEPHLRGLARQRLGATPCGLLMLDAVTEGYALCIEALVRQAYKLAVAS